MKRVVLLTGPTDQDHCAFASRLQFDVQFLGPVIRPLFQHEVLERIRTIHADPAVFGMPTFSALTGISFIEKQRTLPNGKMVVENLTAFSFHTERRCNVCVRCRSGIAQVVPIFRFAILARSANNHFVAMSVGTVTKSLSQHDFARLVATVKNDLHGINPSSLRYCHAAPECISETFHCVHAISHAHCSRLTGTGGFSISERSEHALPGAIASPSQQKTGTPYSSPSIDALEWC